LPDTRQSWTAALLVYAIAWAVLSSPWLSGAVTIPWDAKAHFYPQLQFLAQSIHRGEWPFWTPYVFSGSPQIADPQSLIFSPPFLLAALVDPDPGFQTFDAVVLSTLGVGGAFVMLIFRDRGWHPAGAIVAAVLFAFGASAAWRIQHVGQILSLSFWPVALWLLTRAVRRGSLPYGIAAGAAAGVMALGRDQVAYVGLWLLAGAVLAEWVQAASPRQALRRSTGPLLLGGVTGALVVAVPIGLTLLLAEGSNRPEIGYSEAARGSVHPALLLTAFVPNLFGVDGPFRDYWGPPSPLWGPSDLVLARNMGVLYVGALPIALLAAGLFKGVLWLREARVFTIGLALALLYALGGATPFFRIVFGLLPGADLFRRPADGTFFVGAFAAILAGYVVHRIWTGRSFRHGPPWGIAEILFALAAFAAAVTLAVEKDTLHLAAWPLAKAALCLGVALALLHGLPALAEARPRSALALVLAVLLADLAWNNGPNESTGLPPSMYDVLRPESRDETLALIRRHLGPESLDRVELTALGFHWPNASLVHRLHNVLGYNPVRLGLYTRATGAGDHAALPEQRTFSPLFPSYRSALADQLGLAVIATGVEAERIDPRLRPGDLTPIGRTADGFVYENPRALPRATFATMAVKADFETLLRSGWPDVDPATTVLLEGDVLPAPPAGGPEPERASVRIASYRNTEVRVDAVSQVPGYVVLNDPYHPWWAAEVDGREVPVMQANVLFRAVALPPGSHRVRFVFRPFRGAWRDACRRWPLLGRVDRSLSGILG
jgi:hypothetical protein